MEKSTEEVNPIGLPPWLFKSVLSVALTLGALFVAGQIGRAVGRHAGAEAARRLEAGDRASAPALAKQEVVHAGQPKSSDYPSDRGLANENNIVVGRGA